MAGPASPTWQHLAAVIVGVGVGWAVSVVVEQVTAAGVRRLFHRWWPLLDSAAPAMRYDRSLFTPGVIELQAVQVLLCLAGIGLWLGLARHPLLHATAAAAWLAALALDLWVWQSVEVDDWHVAWRRGAAPPAEDGRPPLAAQALRRLPLAQVAGVHVVERPGAGWLARLAEQAGVRSGTAYLALSFHNGRAVKLPRTSRSLGLAGVQRMAAWIEAQQTAAAQARLMALATEAEAEARATRVDTAALAPVDDEPLSPAAATVLPMVTRVSEDDVIEVDATVVSTVPSSVAMGPRP